MCLFAKYLANMTQMFHMSRPLSAYTLFEKKSYFNSLNRYVITYYHISILQMFFRQCSLKVIFKRSKSFKICIFYLEKVSLFYSFWIGIDDIACKLTTEYLSSYKVHSKSFEYHWRDLSSQIAHLVYQNWYCTSFTF
jgi:hypothetical protein